MAYHKRAKAEALEEKIKKAESTTFLGVLEESASNIAYVVKRGKIIYSNSFNGLSKNDLDSLKGNKKQVQKISKEVDELRNDIYYFIRNLEESSVRKAMEELGFHTETLHILGVYEASAFRQK